MTTPPSATPWPPGRILALLLVPAYLGLASDLRIEHVEAVQMIYWAWTPIIYSIIMGLACLIAVFLWQRITRIILVPLFLAGFIVGGFGMYEHNRHHPERIWQHSLQAWRDPEMKHPDAPPHTAPLTFAGLALLGTLATLRRFN